MYVSKPHNMYLQIGVQTGVLSLLAFLLLYGFYFVESLRCYWNSSGKAQHLVGIGIFLEPFGYMISCIFNDSTVTVAPLFWCLLGAGIAVNQLCKEIER